MASFPIKALGQLGVIADIAPTDLPPNAFTDAINARFVENRVFKTGGSAPISYTDADKNITPLSFVSMPFDYFSDNNSFLIVGTDTKLYKLTNEGMDDVSRKIPLITKKATATVSIFPVLTSITPKQIHYSVETTKTVALEVDTTPDGVRSPDLTWTVTNAQLGSVVRDTTDPKKATFTAGAAEGTLVVKVTNKDGSIEADIYVTIINTSTSIMLNKAVTTIRKGGQDTLVAILKTPLPVTWTTNNPNAIQLQVSPSDSSVCNVIGVAEGTYTVTANNGTNSATATVTVIPTIDSITIDRSSISISPGTTAQLNINYTPTNAQNRTATWVSSAPNIATVTPVGDGRSAIVTAIQLGYCDITATTVEGSRVATSHVSVDIRSANPVPFMQNDDPGDVLDLGTFTLNLDGMAEGNNFFDYSNVDNMEGFGLAPPPATLLTGANLDISTLSVDVGDTFSITATPVPANATDVVYQWKVDRGGYVTTTTTTDPKLDLTAINSTLFVQGNNANADKPIKVTCTISQLAARDYLAYDARPWYHAIISNCAVATTHDEIPQVKEFDSELFTDLPGWGDQTVVDDKGNPSVHKYNWKCERVRAFNNRLFALNMREANASGVVTHYPLRIRWSNFAKENAAPTLWDDSAYNRETTSDLAAGIIGQVEALENGYAGYIDLADSNGGLIEMLPLRDYLFVYTEFETYVGSPTMNSYQPLMWKKLFNDSGILAPECVCEVEGQHFVVTQNDIILHNGTSKKSIASNRVKDKIINEICQVNPLATKVHLHQDKKEVWVLYVGPGQKKDSWACTKAAVWNYEFDTWSFRTIPFSYCIGLVDPPVLNKGPIWTDFLQIPWNDPAIKDLVWRKDQTNFHQRVTVIGSFMKGFYEVDTGPLDYRWDELNSKVVEEPLMMKIERTGIDFDNVTNEWNQKHIQTFRPQVSGRGTYQFITGGTQYSDEYGHEHSTKSYTIGKDRLVCVRLNHPYLFYNVIDNDVDSNAALNGITIEFTIGGRR